MPDEQRDTIKDGPMARQFSDWLEAKGAAAQTAGDKARADTIATLASEWKQCTQNPLAVQKSKWPAWMRYVVMIFFWILMLEGARLALSYGIDKRAIAAGLVLGAIASHALAFLAGLVTLVPVAGPLIVKVLSIPVIWLLNSIGYIISMVAIRRGYSKDVLTYRGMTMALITGIVIGYIIGKLI